MYINKHILTSCNIDYFWNKKDRDELVQQDSIIIHYTGDDTAINSTRNLSHRLTPVSTHLVIARDGKLHQLVDFNTQAWHCGKSELKEDRFFTWFGNRIPNSQVGMILSL